jgi:hypothetical protein
VEVIFPATDYPIGPGPEEYWQGMTGNFYSPSAAMAEAFDWLMHRRGAR